jgi:FkbM family methyltransferase
MAFVSRLRRLLPDLPSGDSSPALRKIGELKSAVAAARDSAQTWKDRAAQLARRTEKLSAELRDAERELARMRALVAETRHDVLATSVVRDSFPHRLGTLAARTRHVPPEERERRLIDSSPAYRAALTQDPGKFVPAVHRMTLEGLTWWIPVKRPDAGPSPASIQKQRFPYQGILRSRELAMGGVMLDLGANIGRMAIPRVVLGDVTAAYCAEPDPVTFACLAANVIDNGLRGLVLPDQTAIGDRNGTVLLNRVGESGSFHVVSGGTPGVRTVEVPCTTLDAWVERLHIDLDAVTFIKVDVEGFERRLVAGASHVLSHRHIVWQMEIKPSGLRAAGDEPRDLYADLQRSFTHFIDTSRSAAGSRVKPINQLADALRYIDPDLKTDVLMFTSVPRLSR